MTATRVASTLWTCRNGTVGVVGVWRGIDRLRGDLTIGDEGFDPYRPLPDPSGAPYTAFRGPLRLVGVVIHNPYQSVNVKRCPPPRASADQRPTSTPWGRGRS